MLCELSIKNIALIESLRIEFDRGLNALTGETGAGKSIVVDCVNLVLGHRGGKELLRTGEEKACVKALFDIADCENAKAYLNNAGIEYDDGYVEVSREINSMGRNSCRINGLMVPLSVLREFASTLVDLHGQQEHQRLVNSANHVLYLDSFGGAEISEKLDAFRKTYGEYNDLRHSLEQLNKDERETALRIDVLNMQHKEISAAKLKPDEEAELIQKNKLYENAEKLSDEMRIAYERLYAGGKSLSAQDSIKKALDALQSISDLDEGYRDLASRLEEVLYTVKDIGYEVQSIYEDLSFDPAEAERVQDRLELIKKLKRKYGPEISDVLQYDKNISAEIQKIENIDENRAELEAACEHARAQVLARASELSESRKACAKRLEKLIMTQLKDLGMGSTVFTVEFRPYPEIRQSGPEEVEFMASTNPGEPLKPLASIASGGEISRFMLALKVILAENDGIETMIFDEIDTGISGRMAQTVGEKMSLLGKNKQVICVTHLAQIAALADTQFAVEKTVRDGRTGSNVHKLDESGRLEEIARLIGGVESSASSTEYARSMLLGAAERRKTLREEAAC